MQMHCLVVGVEDGSDRLLRSALGSMGIRCEHATYSAAETRVHKNRYEAIVLYYDGTAKANDLVQRIRSGFSNRDSVLFALSNASTHASVFRVRANFFINPPVTEPAVLNSFKAAYGLLVRSRSRWHREQVNGTAYLNLGIVKNVQAAIVNLSQGGMSIRCSQVMRPQQLILARFGLPGTDELLCVSAQVVWTRVDGTTGLRFTDVPEPTQKVLRNWVEERLELAKVYAAFREKTGTLGSPSGQIARSPIET
jgi:hypothetical protein